MRSLGLVLTDLDAIVTELHAMNAPPPPPAPVFALDPGDDVRHAILNAPAGAVFVLQPGARYVTGELQLTPKGGTIRTSATLPNRRIGPMDAALLPILASGDNGMVINGSNAANWTFDGIQFESTQNGAGAVVELQNAQNVKVDRCLLVAGPNGQKRGILGNGRSITLTRSHLANIWAAGQDSQCFAAWDGAGPYAITNNYLEGAGENVLFGGSDGGSSSSIPSDIVVEGNLCFKPLTWKGTGKVIKNLFELKVGKRVTVRNNQFVNNWGNEGQPGYGVVITPRNQDGGNPWNCIEDVLFEDNELHNSANGINILGIDDNHASGQTTRVTIRRNLVQVAGIGIQIGGEAGTITIDRNTFENGYSLMMLYGGGCWPTSENLAHMRAATCAVQNLIFTNNLGNHNEYGVFGDNTGIGMSALMKWAPGFTFMQNVLLGGAGRPYPPENWFDLGSVPAGVTVGR